MRSRKASWWKYNACSSRKKWKKSVAERNRELKEANEGG